MGFERAKAALAGGRFADLRWVATTGSTNEDVRDLVARLPGDAAPVVLVADHQSAGRGRLERSWEAPPGSSILMTVGLPAGGIALRHRTLVSVALALAVTDAVPQLALKWPNDLVVPVAGDPLGYRKAGGILTEAHDVSGTPWLLVGLGLNVDWPELPAELADTATSLDRVLGHPVDREDLVVAILAGFGERWLPMLEDPDRVGGLLGAFRARTTTIGRRVRVVLPGGELEGLATDLREDGSLVVADDRGAEHVVTAGDVVHLRPAT